MTLVASAPAPLSATPTVPPPPTAREAATAVAAGAVAGGHPHGVARFQSHRTGSRGVLARGGPVQGLGSDRDVADLARHGQGRLVLGRADVGRDLVADLVVGQGHADGNGTA